MKLSYQRTDAMSHQGPAVPLLSAVEKWYPGPTGHILTPETKKYIIYNKIITQLVHKHNYATGH